jgi:DNA-binding MarR family transcriptional regulator
MDRDAGVDGIYRSLERLRRAQRRRRNARSQTERSGVSLSPLSLSVLAELHRLGPLRVQQLADQADAELPRVSAELQQLQNGGYVELVADPADRRGRLVLLTKFGSVQWRAYQRAGHELVGEVLAGWDDADVLTLATLLERFLQKPI